MTILAGASSGTDGQIQADDRVGAPFIMVPFSQSIIHGAPAPAPMVGGRFHAISWHDSDGDGRSDLTLAVGSVDRTVASNIISYPMVFDVSTADDTTVDTLALQELPLPTGAVSGEALGVSDDVLIESALPVIVGYAHNGTIDAPVYWEWSAGVWSCNFVFPNGFSDDAGRALSVQALIPSEPKYMHITGYSISGGPTDPNAFRAELAYGIGITEVTDAATGCEAMVGNAVSDGYCTIAGTVTEDVSGVLLERAIVWRINSPFYVSIHPAGASNLESAALDISSTQTYGTPVVGWTLKDEMPVDRKYPTFWIDQTTMITFTFLPGFISSSEAFAINPHNEILVRGESGGYALWKWVINAQSQWVGDAFDFTEADVVLPPSVLGATIASLTNINDDGWITGTYIPSGGTDAMPCILVPYDMDNDGEPDFREIMAGALLGSEVDADQDWILDQSEAMRVGLHAPGLASDPEGSLDPVQIIRMKINIKPGGTAAPEGIANEDWVDEIIDPLDCLACTNFYTKITDWSTGSGRTGVGQGEQCEVIVRVHSVMGPSSFGADEGLPESTEDRIEARADLRIFAYRFAHCIDYLQWGNESFGGAGQYRFLVSQLPCATLDGTPYKLLTDPCKREAMELILQWQGEQLEAALIGSALAGRPLRMVSSGISSGRVIAGYCEPDPLHEGRYTVNRLANWCNENRAYFAMHVHYPTADHALDAIRMLVGTDPSCQAPWPIPEFRIATEVGARADFTDDDWWGAGEPDTNFEILKTYFPPSTDTPPETWDDFIRRWKDESLHWKPVGQPWGFRIADVMAEFHDAGFTGICWSALQFDIGEIQNNELEPSPFLVGAIRATKLRNPFFSENPTTLFTPMEDDYSDPLAAPFYKILGFTPHPVACDTDVTCPGCPN